MDRSDYRPNAISRAFEPPIEWWRRASGGMPLAIFPVFILFVVLWCWLFAEVVQELWHLTEGSSADEGTTGDEREHVQALFIAIGLLGALLTAPLVPYRLWLQNRQTVTSEQGLITDRLTKAIEQLGAEKSVKRRYLNAEGNAHLDDHNVPIMQEFTEPNLEVRLGAIYALERIAQDSERDHIPVMETLCAYIRQNAPASEAVEHDLGDWPEWIEGTDKTLRDERNRQIADRVGGWRPFTESVRGRLEEWIDALAIPRVDIQAALTVIGRRSAGRIAYERGRGGQPGDDQGFHLDLRETNLRRAELSGLDFSDALFFGARLEGAKLSKARLVRSNLVAVRLDKADLRSAAMEEACLIGSCLEQAVLQKAGLERADLGSVQAQKADFGGANMRRAGLNLARMEGAHFTAAQMDDASILAAHLQEASLRQANLSGIQFYGVLMDGADLQRADLTRARSYEGVFARTSLRNADLSTCADLTQNDLNTAFGDSATRLPPYLSAPGHWLQEAGDDAGVDVYFQAWLDAGAPPGKPGEV